MFLNQKLKVIENFSVDPDGYAVKYAARTAEGYSFRVRKKSLLALLGQGPGKILDLGCGPGVMTAEIIKNNWTYYGVDISPQMIEAARKKFGPAAKIFFSTGTAEKIDFPDNYFEVISAMGLVEYLDDEPAVFTEIKRVLKPDGRLIVSIPNWWSPARMWDRWGLTPLARLIRRLTQQNQATKLIHREYRLREYLDFLRTQGLEVIRWQSYNYRIIFRPFDFWLSDLTIKLANYFEQGWAKHFWFLGTSINIEAKKL